MDESKPGVRATRRSFLTSILGGTGLVALTKAKEFAAAGGPSGKRDKRSCGEILVRSLTRCPACGRLRGQVEEKWNGKVPVFCRCDLVLSWGQRRPTSMVSFSDDRLMWTPITDYKGPDGRWWHVPYVAGLRYR